MKRPKVVIIGGGFGGLNTAKTLRKANVDITLIDKTNHHLFQPLLYQVATAALSPGDIAVPIRAELNRQDNCTVIMGEVTDIDRKTKKVHLADQEFEYDYLVVATGTRHSYFGNDQWEKFAPGLKTIGDALRIRENILISLEKAEKYADSPDCEKYMTFVIVGGGPTGVEMAGAIAEIAKKTLVKDFKRIRMKNSRVILVEGADRILTPFHETLSDDAKKSLEQMGVEVVLNKIVKDVTEDGVLISEDFVKTPNVIWAAGNAANPVITKLDTETDRAGRAVVNNDCSVNDDESVFVIGDAANFTDNNDNSLPGVAPVAVQQGRYVAEIIKKQIPKSNRKAFKYFDKGNLATIGRARAIMQVKNFRISGLLAWLVWSLVHVAFLINFRKRYKVMAEWIYYYLSYSHGIRLIWRNDTK